MNTSFAIEETGRPHDRGTNDAIRSHCRPQLGCGEQCERKTMKLASLAYMKSIPQAGHFVWRTSLLQSRRKAMRYS